MSDKIFSLANKNIILTGGLGLLGREFTKILLSFSARVIILDILDPKSAAKIMGKFLTVTDRKKIQYFSVDITNKKELEDVRKKILSSYKKIDVLINNAALNPAVKDKPGKEIDDSFENFDLKKWQEAIDVNLTGTMLCCQVYGSVMPGGGSIVNMSSIYGFQAPDQRIYRSGFIKPVSYTVTKGAVLALTKYLAAYWGKKGIRINSISPGGVEGGQDRNFIKEYSYRVPLGRMAKLDEVSGALIFLCSPASSYVTGLNLIVDGGLSIW